MTCFLYNLKGKARMVTPRGRIWKTKNISTEEMIGYRLKLFEQFAKQGASLALAKGKSGLVLNGPYYDAHREAVNSPRFKELKEKYYRLERGVWRNKATQ